MISNNVTEVVFRGGVADAGNNSTASARKTELELPRWALPGHKGLRKKSWMTLGIRFSGFEFFPLAYLFVLL